MYKNKILFLFIFSFVFFTFTNIATVFAADCASPNSCETPHVADCPGGRLVASGDCLGVNAGKLCCAPATPATPTGGLQYTLLEKIPGGPASGSDLPAYVLALYNLALAIVVLSAVFMVSIGGFMYLTSAGNTSAMGTAKGVIFDALIGLVIALTAWLLLNVINPDLTNVSINGLSAIAVPGGGAPISPPPVVAPGGTWPSDATERTKLSTASITINASNCANKGDSGCTSLAGSAAIDALIALKTACGGSCVVKVSGGTECWLHGGDKGCAGGSHHNQGDYAIDLKHDSVLDTYITTTGSKLCNISGRPVYKIGNAVFWDEDSAHWHANFNKSVCTSI